VERASSGRARLIRQASGKAFADDPLFRLVRALSLSLSPCLCLTRSLSVSLNLSPSLSLSLFLFFSLSVSLRPFLLLSLSLCFTITWHDFYQEILYYEYQENLSSANTRSSS